LNVSPIFADHFADPATAAALRRHREDRDALLLSLTSSLKADPRVRAAWLWGSFGRGEADDLSDLDPWLIVSDADVAKTGPSLRLYVEQSGSFIAGGESPQNAPTGGGYFSSLHEGRHGLLHLDCYWQPQSAVYQVPSEGLLFDRLGEPMAPLMQEPSPAERPLVNTPLDGRVEDGLGFAWLMFSISAKHLARDPLSDMSLMLYPRQAFEEAALLLGQAAAADWTVPEAPLEKVERLRHLVGQAERLRLAANTQGYDLSPLFTPCLFCYLDMVEAILRSNVV